MRLTHASSYALHAVVYMAKEKAKEPLASHVIAEAKGIPERFLLKILKPLVAAGVLRSTKGPRGGYVLARPPSEITMLEVVEAVDGPIRGHVGFAAQNGGRTLNRKLEQVCTEVAHLRRTHLQKVSIAGLAR